ncbi:hypothetical protein HF1_02290 [Mycoplasma haemofelis str. Langford 1]|uniref:Uncharacterized protein n=2 Tax=Mycoplasma haemofelis TaxID=29501 RepID=F6FGG1_MYCHI|nr:hypothetical protein [Mycoplasma haemofelis]AEG72551.1 hypothetical protein MHF_0261 [Mycoplasma haemofelis Ohio2]CBY92237.1 hypothetical protein HF1_02290 [Mycoplasma haemofelis str. Langford 1]
MTISLKLSIFCISIIFFISVSFLITIDNYEVNQLVNVDGKSSQLSLSVHSFKKIRPRINSWFEYYKDGNKEWRRIMDIRLRRSGYLLLLSDENGDRSITIISYFVDKVNLWEKLFGIGITEF